MIYDNLVGGRLSSLAKATTRQLYRFGHDTTRADENDEYSDAMPTYWDHHVFFFPFQSLMTNGPCPFRY